MVLVGVDVVKTKLVYGCHGDEMLAIVKRF